MVERIIDQKVACLAVEDVGLAAGRMIAEILDTQIVEQHQRVDVGLLLGYALGTRDLVLHHRSALGIDILRSLGTLVQQLFEVPRSSLEILVADRLVEKVEQIDVVFPFLGRCAVFAVLRIVAEILGHRHHSDDGQRYREQNFYAFHLNYSLLIFRFCQV